MPRVQALRYGDVNRLDLRRPQTNETAPAPLCSRTARAAGGEVGGGLDFSAERYVRVYTRDTGEWLSLSFDGKAVWLMVLRKFDRAGKIRLGRGGRRVLALVLGHPELADRVDSALTELLADGCVELASDGSELFASRFRDAQDWVKSDAERAKDYRRRKSDRGNNHAESLNTVTERHERHATVTPSVPPVPPVPSKRGPTHKKRASRDATKPPHSEHAALVKIATEVYERVRSAKYPFTSRDAKAISNMLERAEHLAIARAWAKALQHHGYPTVSTLAELDANLAHFLGSGPPQGQKVDRS